MEVLDKSIFNKLDIKSQVSIFNDLLEQHGNIKNVCRKVGISYSTIRDRFHKNNYSYNKSNNQYETNTYFEKDIELEKKIEKVFLNMNKKSINPLHNLQQGERKIVIRSFRIHEHILNDFIEYCENSKLKQYDVISLFIQEGLSKYK